NSGAERCASEGRALERRATDIASRIQGVFPMLARLGSLALAFSFAMGCASSPSSEQVQTKSNGVERARSVSDDPKLVAFLESLSAVASGGASLEFFGWKENPGVPSTGCRDTTAADAAQAFSDIVDGVMADGDPGESPQELTPEVIADGKARFK